MHEKNKYRHIPWNRYNLEKYRDIHFWSYRPALVSDIRARVMSEIEATVPQVNVNMTIISDKKIHYNQICLPYLLYFSILGAKLK